MRSSAYVEELDLDRSIDILSVPQFLNPDTIDDGAGEFFVELSWAV